MIRSLFATLAGLFLTVCSYAVNESLTVFYSIDRGHQIEIDELSQLHFIYVKDLNSLNFGFSNADYWVKLEMNNLVPSANYKLALKTIILDTVVVYLLTESGYTKTHIGEGFPAKERFLVYCFKSPEKTATIYLKLPGNGQPISLPVSLQKISETDKGNMSDYLTLGIIYGVVFLILLINTVLFLNTSELIYCYSIFFNLFSVMVLLYFDGMIKLFVFPDSLYWNNESIAIAFCGSFIFTNLYILEFLNIRAKKVVFNRLFKIINGLFLVILVISFWHPLGFNVYLLCNLALTSIEVILLFSCIIYVRNKEQHYFVIQFIGVISLIVFGTIAQLYFLGLLPIHFVTVYAVHFVVLPQIFIQAIALGKRFSVLVDERSQLQLTLIESSEKYSHSLISTIEDERKRLSKEFHDGIGQNILVIRNGMLKMRKQEGTLRQKTIINELVEITSSTLGELRTISQNLRPAILDSLGLTESLWSMVRKLNDLGEIEFKFSCCEPIDGLAAKNMEINIYRILQELTNNILKHANASHALIDITKDGKAIRISVEDDGVGFDVSTNNLLNPGNGLVGIRERVNILNGKISFNSILTQGTTVIINIPIK